MCTVTIVPRDDGGFRMMCNRDEQRTRPEAFAPRLHRLRHVAGVFPIDPISGGTWIGANDRGLAMAILNRNVPAETTPPPEAPQLARSRGVVIPALLEYSTLDAALAGAGTFAPADFEPFRLVVVQGRRVGVIANDGRVLASNVWRLDEPLLFTSSSLGDALVDEPRRRAFADLVLKDELAWLPGQRRFHHLGWPERSELGVVMERADAMTVSRTILDVGCDEIHIEYEALAGVDASATKVA